MERPILHNTQAGREVLRAGLCLLPGSSFSALVCSSCGEGAAGGRTSDGNLGRTLTFCCLRLATINIWPHPVLLQILLDCNLCQAPKLSSSSSLLDICLFPGLLVTLRLALSRLPSYLTSTRGSTASPVYSSPQPSLSNPNQSNPNQQHALLYRDASRAAAACSCYSGSFSS